MKRVDRFASLLDQGVASVINFLHIWLVARYTNPTILADYILLYGAGFLLLKIHAAIICMPLAILSNKSANSRNSTLAWYHGIHLLFLIFSLLISFMVTYGIVLWFDFSGLMVEFLLIPLVLVFNVSFEYVRRILLNYYSKWLSVLFLSIYGVLLVSSLGYNLLNFDLNIINLFLGFSIAVIFCNVIWLKFIFLNGLKMSGVNRYLDHLRNESGILLNNLSQWVSGQGIYYVLMLLSGSGSVAVLAVLRNLFGPLNIVLLSLEGFLPKMFALSYKTGGINSLNKLVIKEVFFVILLTVILLIVLLSAGDKIFELLYKDKYINIVDELIMVSFVFIYLFSFVSRIYLCALRVISEANISGYISIFGLFLLMLIAFSSVETGGAKAAAISMMVSEFSMALLFVLMYRKKF